MDNYNKIIRLNRLKSHIDCCCGSRIKSENLKEHFKTIKHSTFVKNLYKDFNDNKKEVDAEDENNKNMLLVRKLKRNGFRIQLEVPLIN